MHTPVGLGEVGLVHPLLPEGLLQHSRLPGLGAVAWPRGCGIGCLRRRLATLPPCQRSQQLSLHGQAGAFFFASGMSYVLDRVPRAVSQVCHQAQMPLHICIAAAMENSVRGFPHLCKGLCIFSLVQFQSACNPAQGLFVCFAVQQSIGHD